MQQGWWKTAEHRGGAAGTSVDHVGLLGLSAQAQESSPKQVPSRLPECRRGTYTGARPVREPVRGAASRSELDSLFCTY